MIIKIMPETDEEKAKMKKEEHFRVKEYFVFGNKIDENGDLIDFHIWDGGRRFLMSSLYWYLKELEGRNAPQSQTQKAEIELKPKLVNADAPSPENEKMIKTGEVAEPNLRVIKTEDLIEQAEQAEQAEEVAVVPEEIEMEAEVDQSKPSETAIDEAD